MQIQQHLPVHSPRVIGGTCSGIAFAFIGVRCPAKHVTKRASNWHATVEIRIHDAALGTGQLSAARPAETIHMKHKRAERGNVQEVLSDHFAVQSLPILNDPG
jgi:hypothetical protein